MLKQYFQPGREVFREALNAPMPKLLTAGRVVGKPRLTTGAEGGGEEHRGTASGAASSMLAKEWQKEKARLLPLLRKT